MDNGLELARWELTCQHWKAWVNSSPGWEPMQQVQAQWRTIQPRLEQLGQQLDRVLVVGMLGGTGTGKSTLLNAILGERVCVAGDLQRPTTKQPTVLHHPQQLVDFLPCRDWQAKVLAIENPLLEQIILIDCPDPDTQSHYDPSQAVKNRDLLRQILPHCDVLICTGTAQKYKTQIVLDELLHHAAGRAVIFVQTHAEYDADIRNDWQQVLEQAGFVVPRLLRLDSERALQAIENKLPLPPEYRELKQLLEQELDQRGHMRLRRSNALSLLQRFADQAQSLIEPAWEQVRALDQTLDEQSARLWNVARAALQTQLQTDRAAWRTRLLGETSARWGGGPFGVWLRFTSSFWSWVRWLPLLRARGTAAVLLTGTVTAGHAVASSLSQAAKTDVQLTPDSIGWTTGEIAQTESIVHGMCEAAQFQTPASTSQQRLARVQGMLSLLEQKLATAWDSIIAERVARQTKPWRQWCYELPLLGLSGWLFGRWGYSFFYGHLWQGLAPTTWDVILQGIVWILLFAWVLRCVLSWSLLRGWYATASRALGQLASSDLMQPLFAETGEQIQSCAKTERRLLQLHQNVKSWQAEVQQSEVTELSRMS